MIGLENVGVYIFLFAALYFEVFLLITFLESKPLGKIAGTPLSHYPPLTIIIPCHNEEKTVGGTIESLLNTDYPKDALKIFVVDDGSTDATFAAAKAYEYHGNVEVFRKEKGGKHTALNFGIERTNTEFIGGLDADSFVAPYALTEIMRRFEDTTVMAVTPALKVYKPKNLLEYIQYAEYSLSVFYRKMFGLMGALFVTPGPLSVYRRDVFKQIGVFRPAHNTEDMEMALRMQKHRLRIDNAETAHVETVVPRTLPKLLRQRVRWVQGFLQNAIDYRELFLRKKYGNLGMLVLPSGIISIVGAVYFAGYTLWGFGQTIIQKAEQISVVGWSGAFSFPSFDWFYFSTTAQLFLVLCLLASTFVLLSLGKRFVNERMVSPDMLFYFALYGLIAPLWLAKALYNTALAKSSTWK